MPQPLPTEAVGRAAAAPLYEHDVAMHSAEVAQLAARLADEVMARIGEELMARVSQAVAAAHDAPGAAPKPGALLTVGEVLAARPGLSRRWLYDNKGDCGAIQKNRSKSSPLWFRLAEVDALLERRRTRKLTAPSVSSALRTPRPRAGVSRPTSGQTLTPNGAPRTFQIVPRRAR
jgi:hypothetical protein